MMMTTVEFKEGAFNVDATIIGEGLGIEPSLVQARIREGTITSLCERGVDEDAGRYRLTFSCGNRRLRLVVNEDGQIIQRATINFGDHRRPRAVRKPGA